MEINYAVLFTFVCFTLFVIQVCLFVFVFLKCNYLEHVQKESSWEAFPKAEGQPLRSEGLSYFDEHFSKMHLILTFLSTT